MPADRADIHVPSECREMIRAGALVAVNHSGGKDSQAMAVLLSRIVLPGRLVAVHAPLGEVEWPGTVEHIRATLPAGVPLILAPVTSGKTLLHSIEERGRFPSPAVRWCTSSLKRGPIERELRRYLKAHPPTWHLEMPSGGATPALTVRSFKFPVPRINVPVRVLNFPVMFCREFTGKTACFQWVTTAHRPEFAHFRENSLYFPCLTGKSEETGSQQTAPTASHPGEAVSSSHRAAKPRKTGPVSRSIGIRSS